MPTIIYCITNNVNEKVYIGKTISPKRRWREHKSDAKTVDSKLYRAMRKYGVENFTFQHLFSIILDSPSIVELFERQFVEEYDAYFNGYNSTIGGAGNTTYTFDDKFKLKSGEAFRGKVLSPEHKEKLSMSNKGKHNHSGTNNPNIDKTQHRFKNKRTQEEFVGTRLEFVSKYNIKNHGNISSVIGGKLKSAYGWILQA